MSKPIRCDKCREHIIRAIDLLCDDNNGFNEGLDILLALVGRKTVAEQLAAAKTVPLSEIAGGPNRTFGEQPKSKRRKS